MGLGWQAVCVEDLVALCGDAVEVVGRGLGWFLCYMFGFQVHIQQPDLSVGLGRVLAQRVAPGNRREPGGREKFPRPDPQSPRRLTHRLCQVAAGEMDAVSFGFQCSGRWGAGFVS